MPGASLGTSASWWRARTLREVTSRSPLRTRSCAPAWPGADRRDPSVAVALVRASRLRAIAYRQSDHALGRCGVIAVRRLRSPRDPRRGDRVRYGAIVPAARLAPPHGRLQNFDRRRRRARADVCFEGWLLAAAWIGASDGAACGPRNPARATPRRPALLIAECRAPGTGSAFVLVPRQNLDPSVAELATVAIPAARRDGPAGPEGVMSSYRSTRPVRGDRSCGPIGLQLATPVTAPWPGSGPRV